MSRRERASSVTRAFRKSRIDSKISTVTKTAAVPRAVTSGEPPEPPLPLASLFDTAPEAWFALHVRSDATQGALPDASPDTAEWLSRLADLASDFSSRVSLEPPDAVLLEVRGSFRLFGGAQSLCRQLLERCRAAGFVVHGSLAPTPLAALVLARAGQSVIVLARDRLVGVLAPLPLALLRWPAAVIERLDSVGVRTLGAVLRLPRAEFAKRFGPKSLLMLDQLTGAAPELRRSVMRRERFRASVEPTFELQSVALVLQHLEPVLQNLEYFLRTRQSGIDVLMLRLQHRKHPATRLDLRLARAELQAVHFAELLSLQLSRVALPAPVLRCDLRSGVLQTFVAQSESVWRPGEHGGVAGRESPALIERLRARLGADAVYGLCLIPEHRPERAFGIAEPGATAGVVRGVAIDASRSGQAARRPLWLLREPEVLLDAPQRLQSLEGPERIETGWWDGCEVARDYYVARDDSGAELWVYREREPPHSWYLHGVFG
ncbi:MAG: Y-family DNA polymerase [Steroidobacteraceae bacterium]